MICEQILRRNKAKYLIAQKFQTFVVARRKIVFVGIRGVRQRAGEQCRIFEMITDVIL